MSIANRCRDCLATIHDFRAVSAYEAIRQLTTHGLRCCVLVRKSCSRIGCAESTPLTILAH